jgi:hypothetical protein
VEKTKSDVARTRRELAAAVALYLLDHGDEYDEERDEIVLPDGFARNSAEWAIIESLDPSEIEGATALASTRAAKNAKSCAVAQDLHNFAAECLELMHARLPNFDELRELAEAERRLARRYGSRRIPPRRVHSARTARSPRRARCRGTRSARAPCARRSDDSDPLDTRRP